MSPCKAYQKADLGFRSIEPVCVKCNMPQPEGVAQCKTRGISEK
jgi:hypothetical protein